jgi:hypothetical protein
MPSDVREYLQAAQAAEIRGDNARAVYLLQKAAELYENAGNRQRSEQMLRHISRLQAAPPKPAREMETVAPLAPQRQPRPSQLVQRGPTLADPGIDAGCSFCGRPAKELGPLIAGPAGAYICRACAEDALQLLGAQARRDSSLTPAKSESPGGDIDADSPAARALELKIAQVIARLAKQAIRPGGSSKRPKRAKRRRSK